MRPEEPQERTASRRPAEAGIRFGDELRRERELRGVELREIADATKISLRFLEALERNDFEALPGGLFTKGFIRAYAVHIGADPDRLVNAYLLETRRETDSPSGPAPGPRLETRGEQTSGGGGRGALIFLGLTLLIALPAAFFVLRPALLEAGGEPAAPEQRAAPPEPASRLLELVATDANQVRITCDGRDLLDRGLAPGERVVLPCAGSLTLSASSAGDLELWLDGVELRPPAGPGGGLEGWEPADGGPS